MSCRGPFTDVKVHTAKCSAHGPSDTTQPDDVENNNSGADESGSGAPGSGAFGSGVTVPSSDSNRPGSNALGPNAPSSNSQNPSTRRGVNNADPVMSASTRSSKVPQRALTDANLPAATRFVNNARDTPHFRSTSSIARPSSSSVAQNISASRSDSLRDSPIFSDDGRSPPGTAHRSITFAQDPPVSRSSAPVDPALTPRRSPRKRARLSTYHVAEVPGTLFRSVVTRQEKFEVTTDDAFTEPAFDAVRATPVIPEPKASAASALLTPGGCFPFTDLKRNRVAQLPTPITSSPSQVYYHITLPSSSANSTLLETPRRRLTGRAPGPKGLTAAQAKQDLTSMSTSPPGCPIIRKRPASTELTKSSNNNHARLFAHSTAPGIQAVQSTTAPMPGYNGGSFGSSVGKDPRAPIVISDDGDDSDLSISKIRELPGHRAPAVTPAAELSSTPAPRTTPVLSIATERLATEHATHDDMHVDATADQIKTERSPAPEEDRTAAIQEDVNVVNMVESHVSSDPVNAPGLDDGSPTLEEGVTFDDTPTSPLSSPPSSNASDITEEDVNSDDSIVDQPDDDNSEPVDGEDSESSYEAPPSDPEATPKVRVSSRLRTRHSLLPPHNSGATLCPTSQRTKSGQEEKKDPRPQTTEWDALVETLALSEDFYNKKKEDVKPFSKLGLLEPSKPVLRDDLRPIGSQKDLPRELRWNDSRNNGGASRGRPKKASAMETPEDYSDEDVAFKSRAPRPSHGKPYPTSRTRYEMVGNAAEAPTAPSTVIRRKGNSSNASGHDNNADAPTMGRSSARSTNTFSEADTNSSPAGRKVRHFTGNLRYSQLDEDTVMEDAAPTKQKYAQGGPHSLKPHIAPVHHTAGQDNAATSLARRRPAPTSSNSEGAAPKRLKLDLPSNKKNQANAPRAYTQSQRTIQQPPASRVAAPPRQPLRRPLSKVGRILSQAWETSHARPAPQPRSSENNNPFVRTTTTTASETSPFIRAGRPTTSPRASSSSTLVGASGTQGPAAPRTMSTLAAAPTTFPAFLRYNNNNNNNNKAAVAPRSADPIRPGARAPVTNNTGNPFARPVARSPATGLVREERAAREVVVDEEYGDEDKDGDVEMRDGDEWVSEVHRQIAKLREREGR
ncbi:hypothetical protein GTA08_BOTSDO02024 [Botryosphaeria dothidea]|uniref:Uncharacterized protein n=1 Tax=Botryosphaeria dothidea TaxID=55169 RepID=A0A8H4J0B4_9PEZI|nr:hypothetical protein GTA08_BOTSDO02024 [Botryosphaeria dothidea]